ncbi:MAG: hypothetical protein M5R36_02905 [Deltaproteobacteria bacterium]|nr:hypothetical protein [Deltaproteobacteria bacterium]
MSFMEDGNGGVIELHRGNRTDGFDVTPERLYEAIDAAGHYLKNAVTDTGKFHYLYYPQFDSYAKSYNLLRHAGTAFSMAQIYEITRDPELLDAVKRALEYLVGVSMGPDENDRKTHDWMAVTQPRALYAKLGGSGLALLAFGNYTRITGDKQYVPLMQAYGRFIEYMQEPNGHMQQRYWHKPKDKGRQTKPVLYYPGEAFFGLGTLYALDGDMRWMKVVEKGIDYIADVRDINTPTKKLEHDHWLMYATNEMTKVKVKENQLRHARRVTEAMLGTFNYEDKDPFFVGGYYKRPKTTPAACRLEAKTAVYEMAKRIGDDELAERVYETLVLGAGFLMRNQYNDINTMFFPDPKEAIGGYQGHYWDPGIQIDYVQHSTSALIGTRRIMLERQADASADDAAEELKPAA